VLPAFNPAVYLAQPALRPAYQQIVTGATATIAVGSTVGGGEYVAATTVKAAGTFAHTLVSGALGSFGTAGSGLMNTATDATVSALAGVPTTPLYVRITQTATTTAVGTATLVVQYVQNAA
jgi:hypothetical protein